MGIAYFDEYLSEIENADLSLIEMVSSEAEETDKLERKSRSEAKRRKAIEHYQERKRLRNDLEYFS